MNLSFHLVFAIREMRNFVRSDICSAQNHVAVNVIHMTWMSCIEIRVFYTWSDWDVWKIEKSIHAGRNVLTSLPLIHSHPESWYRGRIFTTPVLCENDATKRLIFSCTSTASAVHAIFQRQASPGCSFLAGRASGDVCAAKRFLVQIHQQTRCRETAGDAAFHAGVIAATKNNT